MTVVARAHTIDLCCTCYTLATCWLV